MPKSFFANLHFEQSVNAPSVQHLPPAQWPPEWSTLHFKAYPRMRRFPLTPESKLGGTLRRVLSHRASRRNFTTKAMSFRQLSTLLYWSAGLQQKNSLFRRMYPSGGARFPLEVYPLILRGALPKGLYHYNAYENSLELLWERDFSKDIPRYFLDIGTKVVQKASVILLVTAVFDRNQIKYGERGYRYIFVEAGHLGQNVYLVADALGLKCCAVGGYIDKAVNDLLDVDGLHEAAIYTLAIGT